MDTLNTRSRKSTASTTTSTSTSNPSYAHNVTNTSKKPVESSRVQSRSRRSSRAHNFSRPSPSNIVTEDSPYSPSTLHLSNVFATTHDTTTTAFHSSAFERVDGPLSPRAPSPGGLSRVSTSSSAVAGGPLLRKKPKSLSIKNDPRPDAIDSSIASEDFSSQSYRDEQAKLIQAHNPANSSKPLSRANSDHSQSHSPVYKRPPASHSSYGVETAVGPPPSYTTQRKISQERIRKPDRNTIIWNPPTKTDTSADAQAQKQSETRNSTAQNPDTGTAVESSPEPAETQGVPTLGNKDLMANVTMRGKHAYPGDSTEEESKSTSSDERKSEDLFLNIAKVDAAQPASTKAERRRSRVSLPFLSSSRSMQDARSPVRARADAEQYAPPQPEVPKYYSKRSSLGSHIPGAFSRNYHHDGYKLREQSLEPNSDAELSDRSYARRHSNANADTIRLAHRPSQGLRGQRYTSEAAYIEPAKTGETVATESTVSTAAPSTVWDELDDLKSRIRKLELTGKLPPSSAAAMSSAERPRTATTTATSMSMSPKYLAGGPALQSSMEGISSSIHPLLHEALGNAKQVLSNDIYQKLYATASDALQLAAMMNNHNNHEAQSSVSHSTTPMNERQVRRRTESLCRGLTELSIALTADLHPATTALRPLSRESSSHPPSAMLRSRRYSNDPGERPMSSRVGSRLENRRTSIHAGHSVNGLMSPEPGFRESPTTLPQLPGMRLNRPAVITRNRRGPGIYDGADDDSDASPSVRPLSRAQTDLNSYRRAPPDHTTTPRDVANHYTPPARVDHNIAASTPPATSVNATFISRRKYASPGPGHGDHSPAVSTPREGWGPTSLMTGEHESGAGLTTPETMGEGISAGRTGSTRRSLGFAGRIGSSMGSRLRAVRADRGPAGDTRNPKDGPIRRSDHYGN